MTHTNDTPLKLSELLDSVGMSKTELSVLMNVSRSTIMRLGDKVTDEVLSAIDEYRHSDQASETIPLPVIKTQEMVRPETYWPVTNMNIALSRIKYGREGMTIDNVARLFNLSVFDYNQAVDKVVDYCIAKNTSFNDLRA